MTSFVSAVVPNPEWDPGPLKARVPFTCVMIRHHSPDVHPSDRPYVLCLIAHGGRAAARLSGLASGLALAVRPAGLAEVSGVNGAPQARSAQRDAKHR